MARDSEFRSYAFIEQMLRDLGWNTNNPARRAGSVYTQGEFRGHDPLLTDALGRKTPENIITIPWYGGNRYWIVEAKRSHQDLKTALDEAQGYADIVNAKDPGVARFATGFAGSPADSFYVQTAYWNGSEWNKIEINDYRTTGFLTLEQCNDILEANNHKLAQYKHDPKRLFDKVNDINSTLHDNEIPVNERAQTMAALLLALAQDDNFRIHEEPIRLIRELNGLIHDILRGHSKEAFSKVIDLKLPATEKNHKKYRKAIIDTLQHLREMNIRSAINSGEDTLGQFYETFLKYANDAKEIGIVLTPRHITRFAVDVVGIKGDDKVFDPTCGTGGFLVSAMEALRSSGRNEYRKFQTSGLYGIEQRDDVYGLAVVNMIFRGDGNSGIYDGDCFAHEFWLDGDEVKFSTNSDKSQIASGDRPFTRVLMNPPFKLPSNSESEFVDYALRQMRYAGTLFAVLPNVVIAGGKFKQWRKELLNRHTVKACIKLDKNLFSPVSEATYALILKAHIPHEDGSKVFMGVLHDDANRLRKSKLISDYEMVDNVVEMTETLKQFLQDSNADVPTIPRKQIVLSRNLSSLEDFSPENCLPNGDVIVSDIGERLIASRSSQKRSLIKAKNRDIQYKIKTKEFKLKDFVDEQIPAQVRAIKDYPRGSVPVVGAGYPNNGVVAWLDIPPDMCVEKCITVSTRHNTRPCEAYWHPYFFATISGHAWVLKLKPEWTSNEYAIMYLCQAITSYNAWRYNYARTPKLEDIAVILPATEGGGVDIALMAKIAREQAGE